MNDLTPRKFGGSLLERAAARFDLDALLGAAAAPAPPSEAVAPQPSPIQAPTAAPRPSVSRGAMAAIDRDLLARNGLLVPGAPVSALAEEFRLIKRQLIATAHKAQRRVGERARTILVCSANAGDGKTYCATNLAISMAAERDMEVLLVDADFARPSVVGRLGLNDGPGFLDVIRDTAIDPEGCVIATDIPHLAVLPSGTKGSDDTELLASRRTEEVIDALLDADPARLVIFDSPPALAASLASVLAGQVGQVMLVVRADRTGEGDLRETVTLLDACEHIQLVLNAVSFAPGGRKYGNYYYYQEDAK